MFGLAKTVVAIGATVLMATQAASPALAWSDRLEGQPENLEAGGDPGFYLWHDERGLHLRTTGPGDYHRFTAELRTPGEFRNVCLVRLEGDDGFLVRDGGHTLDLRFETWGGIDGVDFTIEGGRFFTIVMKRDGELIDTEEIYLGEGGEHPNRNPFVERR